mgnify:CR=1 FL=1
MTVELQNIRTFAAAQPGVAAEKGKGFPDFLHEVLNFRLKAIRALGGAFVKNSLIDYHSELISNYEKMSFIKLEMLRRVGVDPRPRLGAEFGFLRGIVEVHVTPAIDAFNLSVIARSTRIGASRRPGTGSATKQSSSLHCALDCFASLAMTRSGGYLQVDQP